MKQEIYVLTIEYDNCDTHVAAYGNEAKAIEAYEEERKEAEDNVTNISLNKVEIE
jgi:hypothetical protein